MKLPSNLDPYYYQQGFNYADSVPDDNTKFGGGCQASSLLIGVRLMSGNPHLTMSNIFDEANKMGLVHYDLGFADRISYGAIALIASSLLKDCKVTIFLETPLEEITEESTNVFGRESNKIFLNIPNMSSRKNLSIEYGVNKKTQVEQISKVLGGDGIAIPLIHPNTLHQSTNPDTDCFKHAIVLTGFNRKNQTISVIDPNPGFTGIPNFASRKDKGTLKIPSNRVHSIEMANRIASKYHPRGSVIYEIDIELLEKSLRGVSTTISR
jgi:hypothetical protein